jgi:hypothetical protein
VGTSSLGEKASLLALGKSEHQMDHETYHNQSKLMRASFEYTEHDYHHSGCIDCDELIIDKEVGSKELDDDDLYSSQHEPYEPYESRHTD